MPARRPESFCIEARFPDAATAELASAEAWEAGAEGIEERVSSADFTLLLLYANRDRAASVRAAVAGLPGARVSEPVPVEEVDWSQAWREGLEAIRVGTRLVVRPSWVAAGEPAPGVERVEIVLDPGQAFGTGAHVSTRLVLDEVEALSHPGAGGLGRSSRVLDVGTGSGVLALAALGLGAGRALGFDLDPESGIAAQHWARSNRLADRFSVFVGPIDALHPAKTAGAFDWVLANLLKREVMPLAAAIAERTRPGGQVILSGLLASEEDEVRAAFARVGFGPHGVRYGVDPNGDAWVCLRLKRS